MEMFDENVLRREIAEKWGEHGAHTLLYELILDKARKLAQAESRAQQEAERAERAEKLLAECAESHQAVCLENVEAESRVKEMEAERDQARATVAAMREAVLEFEHVPPEYPRFFVAYSPGKPEPYAIPPEKVEGFFRALDSRWKSDDVKRWSEEFRTARSRSEKAEADKSALREALLDVEAWLKKAWTSDKPIHPADHRRLSEKVQYALQSQDPPAAGKGESRKLSGDQIRQLVDRVENYRPDGCPNEPRCQEIHYGKDCFGHPLKGRDGDRG